MSDPLTDLPRGHFKAILADPPWRFEAWSGKGAARSADQHYDTMTIADMCALPVAGLAADDCVLFVWSCWPLLRESFQLIEAWGFQYKTCGFDWMKADDRQADFLSDSVPVQVGMGYWTRANSEPCLLATRGKPKRIHADVRMGIIEPRREHSRKPDCVHERIQRLVAGPYLELFGRQQRPGWTVWGNETDKFGKVAA